MHHLVWRCFSIIISKERLLPFLIAGAFIVIAYVLYSGLLLQIRSSVHHKKIRCVGRNIEWKLDYRSDSS